jgi:hypothetical protein
MKILYAASDSIGASIQLNKFLIHFPWHKHTLKISAYHGYNYLSNIDYNLHFLTPFKDKKQSIHTDNTRIYYNELDKYNPDLIISDLDILTSYYAIDRKTKLWQYSADFIYYYLSPVTMRHLSLSQRFIGRTSVHRKDYEFILSNSDKCLYPSLYDLLGLKVTDVEIIDPLSIMGDLNPKYNHKLILSLYNNKRCFLKHCKEDSLLFTTDTSEFFKNIKTKYTYSDIDYYNNIVSSDLYMCDLYSDFIFDGLINNQTINSYINFSELSTITNFALLKHLGLINVMDYVKPERNDFIFYHEPRSNIIDKVLEYELCRF